jgi:hypothetical protein
MVLFILWRSISIQNVMVRRWLVQVLRPPQKFERPPFCNGWRYGIKKYGFEVTFHGITSLLNSIWIYQSVQKLLGGTHRWTDRQDGDLISLTFLFKEIRLKMCCVWRCFVTLLVRISKFGLELIKIKQKSRAYCYTKSGIVYYQTWRIRIAPRFPHRISSSFLSWRLERKKKKEKKKKKKKAGTKLALCYTYFIYRFCSTRNNTEPQGRNTRTKYIVT